MLCQTLIFHCLFPHKLKRVLPLTLILLLWKLRPTDYLRQWVSNALLIKWMIPNRAVAGCSFAQLHRMNCQLNWCRCWYLLGQMQKPKLTQFFYKLLELWQQNYGKGNIRGDLTQIQGASKGKDNEYYTNIMYYEDRIGNWENNLLQAFSATFL